MTALFRKRQLYVRYSPIGNLMFRYMFARHLQDLLPGFKITGYRMPEWGLVSDQTVPPSDLIEIGLIHKIDVGALVRRVQASGRASIDVNCYAQRLEYFESGRRSFIKAFASPVAGTPIRPDEIAIHVRAGNILNGSHGDYWPVPISWYRHIVAETGLAPVFIGQLQPSPYMDALRKTFPHARYLSACRWLDDFQTIRGARNIALAVSTFSWLAAWLSNTAEIIYQPLLGFLNPQQRPDIDLKPRLDTRYRFTEFPVETFVANGEQMKRIFA
jgi:hypothetical protein